MAKKITLYLILLIALSICGTLVLKIYDLIFKIGYENIIMSGFKIGLIAWIGMLINECYHTYKNKNTNK